MSSKEFAVDFKDLGREGIRRAFAGLVDLMAQDLVSIRIDAYSDHNDLSPEAERAQQELFAIGGQQLPDRTSKGRWSRLLPRRTPDPGMAVSLDPRKPEHLSLFKIFGPRSIHTEAYAEDPEVMLIVAHDSGSSIVFVGDDLLLEEFLRLTGIERRHVSTLSGE